jgi:hypothetical protein
MIIQLQMPRQYPGYKARVIRFATGRSSRKSRDLLIDAVMELKTTYRPE